MNGIDPGAAYRMDRMYRLQRWIYDPTRRWYLLGRDRLIQELAVPASGSVLEIACGTGRNLIRIGEQYPTAGLYGIDISAEMLKSANGNRRRAGLEQRLSLAVGDAMTFDPAELFAGQARFDRIVIAYALSMIPQWRAVVDHAVDLLTPEGRLEIVDFGQMEPWPAGARAAMRQWLRWFDVTPQPGIAAYVDTLAWQHDAALRRDTLGGGYAEIVGLCRDAPRRHHPSAGGDNPGRTALDGNLAAPTAHHAGV